MKAFLLFTLILGSMAFFNEEEGLVIVTENNMNDVLKTFEYIMVMFYAPFDQDSVDFIPSYREAAQKLKHENLRFGLVDVTNNKKLSAKYDIRINGKPTEYNAKKEVDVLVKWMHENSIPLVTQIANLHELEQFKESYQIVMMYFGRSTSEELDQVIFESMAQNFEGVYFGVSNLQELRDILNLDMDEKVVLFTPYEGKKEVRLKDDITKQSLEQFINLNSYPTIFSYNKREEAYIEKQGHPTIILFVNKQKTPEETAFVNVANELSNEIVFTLVNKKSNKQIEQFYSNHFDKQFQLTSYPQLFIYDTRDQNDFKKYKLEKTIDEYNMRTFISEFKNDSLEQWFRSQKMPVHNQDPVKVVVAKSFQWEVIDCDQDVVLLFYSSNDPYSTKYLPTFEQAAKLLLDNKNLKLAKFDIQENDVPQLKIKSTPTVKMFKKGNEEIDVIDYKGGERTLEELMKFMRENVYYSWIEPQMAEKGEEPQVKRKQRKDDL